MTSFATIEINQATDVEVAILRAEGLKQSTALVMMNNTSINY